VFFLASSDEDDDDDDQELSGTYGQEEGWIQPQRAFLFLLLRGGEDGYLLLCNLIR